MQETQYYENTEPKSLTEIFRAPSDRSLDAAMDARFEELQEKGHTLVRRVKVGRNAPCPCESGKKFKRCCLK
jgi:uncharacterized protein YecA (UPF0149 family)